VARKKADGKRARTLLADAGQDPLEYLISLLSADTVKEVEIIDGKKTWVERPVTTAMKREICRDLMPFCYPRLNAQTISGPDEGPVQTVNANIAVSALTADPSNIPHIQALVLAMCRTPAPAAIEAAASDAVETAVEAVEATHITDANTQDRIMQC
jgi:hypothetical protein